MRTTAGIALTGAALPLLLGACGSTGGQAAAPTDASVPPSEAAATPTTPAPLPARSETAAPTSSGTTPRCHTSDLSARLGAKSGTGQVTVPVIYTNVSDHVCTMQGFGGVDLDGPEYPTWGPTYSLPRQEATPQPVRLPLGGHAHVVITYLVDDGQSNVSGPWTPTTVVVTPPDETTQLHLAWTAGDAVARQDAATHPGTYIGPVTAGE